jgi:hypothetical protein
MSCFRAALFVLFALAPSLATAAPGATLFRLFLTDGTEVVSFGEYARVGEDVIFSMPVAGSPDAPRLQLVTMPAAKIDWVRTERYSAAARAEHYATTRGDEDFLQLSNEVARVLNDVALSSDRAQALALVQRAHDVLVQWPQDHYRYRESEVREIQAFVDSTMATLRGLPVSSFQLALVTSAADFVRDPIPAMPVPKAQLEQLLHVADLTARVTERVALLQTALSVLNEAVPGLAAGDAASLRTTIEDRIRYEGEVDRRYDRLGQRLLVLGKRGAAAARVGEVERAIARLDAEDARLGRERPDTVQAVRAELGAQLDDARRLRLLRDQWILRRSAYQEYQRRVGVSLLELVKARPLLESIRRLDGPAPARLTALRSRLSGGAERLQRLTVPPEVQNAHDLLVSAWRFAENAVTGRYEAVASGNVATAWTASSAAAGALMMLNRAQDDIRILLEIPRLK